MSTPDRRAVLDRTHPELSVRRQCALLSLARSGVYRPVAAADETDLALMRRIDELSWPIRSWARAGWSGCCRGRVSAPPAHRGLFPQRLKGDLCLERRIDLPSQLPHHRLRRPAGNG